MQTRRIIAAALLLAAAGTRADVRIIDETGIGVRALSFANNNVASPTDLSAAYWNPAGLAFLPVRSFEIGLGGHQLGNTTTFFGREIISETPLQRIRISSMGLLNAVPTTQGGLTWGIAFQNPVVFDDMVSFRGRFSEGGGSFLVDRDFKTYGGLRFWTGAVGLQVAPGTALGVALSLVTGSETTDESYFKLREIDDTLVDDFDRHIETRYTGYDIRAGLQFRPLPTLDFGVRLVIPQMIHFNEQFTEEYPHTPLEQGFYQEYDGKLVSSYSAAVGMAVRLPFTVVSLEARGRAPYNLVFPTADIPAGGQAREAKKGCGIGVEVPLVVAPVVARAGYSYDQVDLHTFAVQYKGERIEWSDDGMEPDVNRHFFSGGIGYLKETVSLELAAGYRMYDLETRGALLQKTRQITGLASLGFRY